MPGHSYDDIIDLPHHVSNRHPPMSMRGRASQFSPFAALSSYGAAVRETARLTERQAVLDGDTVLLIDARLRTLHEREQEVPAVNVTYFEPDSRKDGGHYLNVNGQVRQVDGEGKRLILTDGTRIEFGRILWIDGIGLDEIIGD